LIAHNKYIFKQTAPDISIYEGPFKASIEKKYGEV